MRKFWPALIISGLMLIATAGCNLPNKQSEEEPTVGVEEKVKEEAPETQQAPAEVPAEVPAGNVTEAPIEGQAPEAPAVAPEAPAAPAEAPAPEQAPAGH